MLRLLQVNREVKFREVKFDVYGERQTFAVCLQLSVQKNQDICICSE